MFLFLATAPVSFPLSMMGQEPNFNNPVVVVLVILAVTAMVYGVVVLASGLWWLARGPR